MNRTKIEWVRNPDGSQGYTWNPITGCLNGCPYCFARKLAESRLEKWYLGNNNIAPFSGLPHGLGYIAPGVNPFYPRFWPEKLNEPMIKYRRWGKHSSVCHDQSAKGIFTCDMSDLFGIGIPTEWTQAVLDTIRSCPQHRFYLLTKQPWNLKRWSPFPDNCWVGVSATNDNMALEAMLILPKIEAKVKFISFEPLHSAITLPVAVSLNLGSFHYPLEWLDWLIIGAETGNRKEKPPLSEVHKWAKEIIAAADEAGIPLFIKDNLKWPVKRQEWPLTK